MGFREVSKGVAVIPLHTLMSGSEVQIDVPPPLAACGLPHGAAYAVLYLPFGSSNYV